MDGGIIILDDYFNENWPGVSEGLNKYMIERSNVRLKPFLIGGNKLFLTTSKEYCERYIYELNRHRIGTTQKVSMMYGSIVMIYGFTKLSFSQKLEASILWKKLRTKSLGRLIKRVIRGYS